MTTYYPLIAPIPQSHLQGEILYRLCQLKHLLKSGYAAKIRQDIDDEITMDIYKYESDPARDAMHWVRIWKRYAGHRTIHKIPDIDLLIVDIWESIPSECKKDPLK